MHMIGTLSICNLADTGDFKIHTVIGSGHLVVDRSSKLSFQH